MPNVKIDQTQRGKLGRQLYDYVTAGLNAKGDLPESVWGPVEAYHRNERAAPDATGFQPIHEPLSQPRQDALTSQVCMVIGRQEPYMLAGAVRDPVQEDALQRLVHRMWQQAGFEMRIREVCTISTDTNKGLMRLCPKVDGKPGASRLPGVQIDVIHPKDFTVFPVGPEGIAGAVLVGHRYYRRIGQVKDLMRSRRYYDAAVSPSDQTEHDETGSIGYAHTSLGSTSSDRDADLTELFECVVRLRLDDRSERMYQAVVAMSNQELLLLEPYPYARAWYFECPLIADAAGFWGGKSVGRNLFSIQNFYNLLAGLIYDSGATAAKPPIIGPKLAEKYTTWKAGDYIESDDPVQPWSPNTRPDVSSLVQKSMNCERNADMVARVSQNTLGANNAEANTATENSIIASGVAVGIEEYIANFTSDLPAMAEHTVEIAKGMYGRILNAYGDVPEPEALDLPAVWEVAGKSPSTTPAAKIQAAMQVMQLASIPGSGINTYRLAQVILANSGLSGVQGIQQEQQPNTNAQPQLDPNVGQVPGVPPAGNGAPPPQGPAPFPGAQVGPLQAPLGNVPGAGPAGPH